MQRIIKFNIFIIIIILSLPGCGVNHNSAHVDKKIVFMMIKENGMNEDSLLLKKVLKDKFNLESTFILSAYDVHKEKLKIMMATNDMPDVITPMPDSDAKSLGVKKALVPINQYLNKMPNYKKFLMEVPEYNVSMQAVDGNIYNIARFVEGDDARYVPIIRKDLLDELSMVAPSTFSELYNFLLAVKQKYPESKGIVNREKLNFINDYGTNYNTNISIIFDQDKDKWVFAPAYEGFKELITDFKKLFDAKLLDSEFFTASSVQWKEKVINGEGAFTLSWPEYADEFEYQHKIQNPDDVKFDLSVILPLTSNTRKEKYVQKVENMNSWCSWAISSKSEFIDDIIKVADFMYTEEGISLFNWGPKDKYYVEENGKKKFKDNVKVAYNPMGTIDIRSMFGINYDHISRVGRKSDNIMGNFSIQTSDMINKIYYENNVKWFMFNNFIKLPFTEEQMEEINSLNIKLDAIVADWALKLITGEVPISDYDSFINELKLANYKRLEEIYAQAYDYYKSITLDTLNSETK